MNDHEYRTMPRYANSDLSELAAVKFNRPLMKAGPESLRLGSAFHALVLEPQREWVGWAEMAVAERRHVANMYDSLLAYDSGAIAKLILQSECEKVRQWTCPKTGLPLKAKIDMCVLPRRRHIIDLKTTSVKSQVEFEETIEEYHYDRQAAFYLSSEEEAVYFEFIGVQKQPPYNIYRVLYSWIDPEIQRGRVKMEQLLRLAYYESRDPSGWRPSSWSRKEVGV